MPESNCRTDHEWIEVGDRRWCIRRYDHGGCEAFQTRRDERSPWYPAVAATCDEQKKLHPNFLTLKTVPSAK